MPVPFFPCTSFNTLGSGWHRNIICCAMKSMTSWNDYRICQNPQLFGCEMNEDVVGRLSRLSRRVSTHNTSERSLQLYLIKSKAVYRRWAQNKKLAKPKRHPVRWSGSEIPDSIRKSVMYQRLVRFEPLLQVKRPFFLATEILVVWETTQIMKPMRFQVYNNLPQAFLLFMFFRWSLLI